MTLFADELSEIAGYNIYFKYVVKRESPRPSLLIPENGSNVAKLRRPAYSLCISITTTRKRYPVANPVHTD